MYLHTEQLINEIAVDEPDLETRKAARNAVPLRRQGGAAPPTQT